MNRLKNNNTDIKKKATNRRKNRFAKIYTILSLATFMIFSAINSAFAKPNAPAGASSSEFNSVVNVVFWILEGAMAIYAGVSLFHIVKGVNDQDPRTRNEGIVGLIIAALCIGGAAAIKNIFF